MSKTCLAMALRGVLHAAMAHATRLVMALRSLLHTAMARATHVT